LPQQREFPFPAFPNGWFCVGYSDELAPGDVRKLRYFGRDLVLFREEGSAGAARILDAFCPHLGAHLGVGGRVEGDGIRCPFHAWKWDGEGRCVDIPYARRIPPNARIGTWPACERNGFVFVWHHAEGEAPDYEIPKIPEIASGWTPFTKLDWTVKSRMYDMGENAVDHVHFKYLHGASGAPTGEQRLDEDGTLRNYSEMEMTTPRGPVPGSIESRGVGPGMGVVHVKGVVETIIVTKSTPVDDETVHVRFSYTQKQTEDEREQRIGRAMLRDLKKQMEQDIVIFENKTYWTNPLLVPEDGPIAEYRRRARASYSGRFWDE
jgi:phenylpropionate dioxygenase-like ring-hydroxylating dioxygenase large terminal subunit